MATDLRRRQRADALYEEVGRPLEAEHRGRYVAIAADGRFVLAPTAVEALLKGQREPGPGNVTVHVGNRFVVTWR